MMAAERLATWSNSAIMQKLTEVEEEIKRMRLRQEQSEKLVEQAFVSLEQRLTLRLHRHIRGEYNFKVGETD
jgi:hypothetical protein